MHRILDIGTGPGRLLLSLNQVLPHSELVGVDISPAMVAQACKTIRRAGLEKAIHLRVSSANALPFADNTFDCVVSTGSFHHWKDPAVALAEVHRVLKSNGTALMYDLVRKMPAHVRAQIRSRFGSLWHILLWLHSFEEPFLAPAEMVALGKQSEFVVVETRFVGALCCLVLRN
jgi:ubiquinone/menaquinone biosynthesis C-methylase UbiE